MKIHVKAPNRVDLSGGTLDIYPLYVFEDGACTVNAAIDLVSEVELETRPDARIHIHSQDLGQTLELESLAAAPPKTDLDFLLRIVRFYQPRQGLNLSTRNQAPQGSGLGASSALLIALSYALSHFNTSHLAGDDLIRFGADIEAQHLGIPTGKQDYYPALYGGVNALHFGLRGVTREALPLSAAFLEQLNGAFILSFTGESHFSGTSNWNMLKAYIEDSGHTRRNLRCIKQTSAAMRQALLNEDWPDLIAQLQAEWENRRTLADGVSTPQIERMMAAATAQGALASKICGAGGGGCMMTLCQPDKREAVSAALRELGAQILPARIVEHGLTVQSE